MANMVPGNATAFFGNYKKRQLWLRIVIGLAAVVVFFTTYALILPAITMEGNLVCELEEHTHTEECYTIDENGEQLLICEKQEHTHTSDCYDAPASGDIKYICDMDEHTHGDACYNEDGELVCTMPEHTHTEDCVAKKRLKSFLAAVNLLGANDTTEKIYWKPITDTDELTKDGVYMIVTAENEVALNGASQATTTTANMQPAAGKSGYYTSELGDNYWWKISNNASSSKIYNVATNNYLNLKSKNSLIGKSSNGTTNKFVNQGGTKWWIYTSETTGYIYQTTTNYNLVFDGTKFTYDNDGYLPMTIYKQYIEEVPVEPTPTPTPTPTPSDDPGGGGGGEVIIKPTYPAYVQVSGPKTGETAHEGVKGNYWSDPSTSQLESKFNGVSADDGKVLTDKSVIYGKDDYGAFKTYDDNTFGVTLSALAQTYAISEKVHAPIDVVFVVDTSGSMIASKYNGTNAATETVKALNQAMNMVLTANDENRVGVVCFSNYSHKILDLGRYTATNDKYFPDSYSNYGSNTATFAPSSSLRNEDGTRPSTGSFTAGWYGTYTQAGIAEGAKELINEQNTTVDVDVKIDAGDGRTITKTVTMQRRPVIILLSDGDPTFCNEHYDAVLENNASIHGDGGGGYYGDGTYKTNRGNSVYNSWRRTYEWDNAYPADYSSKTQDGYPQYEVNNNKGINGYYTILSANYYKNEITKHYGYDTYFYSIGLGMNEGSKDSIAESVTSDIYKTAVLNPTAANISALATTSGRVTNSGTVDTDISGHTLETSTMLRQLLNNTISTSNNKWVKNANGQKVVYIDEQPTKLAKTYGSPNATTGTVPIINNPYSNGYQYTNGASFTNKPTAQELAAIYEKAISAAGDTYVYGFMMKNGTSITVSDTIGKGMEIVRDSSGNTVAPVLNYGGKNYSSTSHETVDGKTIYHYKGTYTATDGSGREVDLSNITAVVETVDGQQKVSLKIPEDAVPLYRPCVDANNKIAFYYEDLPARLIYQVGLTAESKDAVAKLKDTGGELTFYTNEWKNDTNYANAEFEPTSKNPYYKDDDYDKNPLRKTENTTETKSDAWKYESKCDDDYVKVELGNNGKLHFEAEVPKTPIEIHKVNMLDQTIVSSEASFKLYSDENLENLIGSYTTKRGVLTINDLTVGQTYYLVETTAPDGFNKCEEPIAFKVTGLNKAEVIGQNSMASFDEDEGALLVRNDSGYELPESGGIGTPIIYALGALLIAGALMYGSFLRRKSERRAK